MWQSSDCSHHDGTYHTYAGLSCGARCAAAGHWTHLPTMPHHDASQGPRYRLLQNTG